MKKRITVQKMSSKDGVSKSGKNYVKYGIQDQDGEWYNSFQPINAVEAGEFEIEYETTQYGNDLKDIKQVGDDNVVKSSNRQNSIIRQHSQEMALYYFDVTGKKDFTEAELKEKIQWFADDADQDQPF